MADSVEHWVRIAAAEDVGDGCMADAKIGGLHVVVYNHQGKFYATDNICSHAYALLSDGWLDGEEIECPLHGGRFSIVSGAALTSPVECDLRTFPTRIEDGELKILIDGVTNAI